MTDPLATAFENIVAENTRLKAELEALRATAWQPVEQGMPPPDKKVLATYLNELGNRRTIVARWTPAKTVEASGDEDSPGTHEYDEATDTYYLVEGWWECINNWDDYSQVFVSEGVITHWMHLPAAPAAQNATTSASTP